LERKEKKEPSKGLVIAAFIALYTIWGSTYLGNLIAIQTIPPFIMAGLRFFIAGIILLMWCLFQKQQLPSWDSIAKISLAGLLMLFIGTGAVIWVEQYIPSGLTAVIVATVPLWFVALDKREWKMYFSNKWIIIGLLIGFLGVLLLFGEKGSLNLTGNRMQLIGFFILTGGSISWAIGSLYSKYKPVEGNTTMKAALQMLAAGVASFIFAFITGEHHHFHFSQVSMSSIYAVVYLIVFGSLIGYISYIWLLSVRPPSLVGTYAYVNPVVAVFLGWLIISEKISIQQIIALCIILAGVIMVNLSREKV
jgi:drug/metabolite transporter (DMT)-like permease